LSKPSLETLAIIAYRQPVSRAEIENVRGVSVDHVVRSLLEMQLVRIVGRSELPGRPFLYGTTQLFFEHFGLKSMDELNEIEPLLSVKSRELEKRRQASDESESSDVSEDGDDLEENKDTVGQDDES
jgi:segregation and condensation protein B